MFNLTLLLVLLSGLFLTENWQIGLAVVVGLAVDLFYVYRLGTSSFIFLVAVTLYILYKRRFSGQHPLFFSWVVFLADIAAQILYRRQINLLSSLVLTGLGLTIFLIFKRPDQRIFINK